MALVDATWTQPNVDVDRMREHVREASELLKGMAQDRKSVV